MTRVQEVKQEAMRLAFLPFLFSPFSPSSLIGLTPKYLFPVSKKVGAESAPLLPSRRGCGAVRNLDILSGLRLLNGFYTGGF
jgi:hypothetical protein